MRLRSFWWPCCAGSWDLRGGQIACGSRNALLSFEAALLGAGLQQHHKYPPS